MLNSFRQSMAWVHTWFGLVLGFVLMVAFFFGAQSAAHSIAATVPIKVPARC